ncbi:MAG: cupredoxin domain-containing protein [Chloroflexi bacterium]|nr:cupredoxin domain-containing protein [Chloroflexota bacterium]
MIVVAAGLLTISGGAAAAYAQSTTTVALQEFSFTPDRMVVSAGRDTFTLQNTGRFPHNMHIEGNGVAMDVKADGPVPGGETFTGAVTLAPGSYEVWCPVSNHREQGMVATLIVGASGAGAAAQVPTALPRTGDADPALPLAQASIGGGLLLLGAGLFVRRRAATNR